jgi:hypothetical protein
MEPEGGNAEMEKSFKALIREFIGQKVSFNIGLQFGGSGKLLAVHDDCVEMEFPGHGNTTDTRRSFIPLAHLHVMGEA